MMEVRVVQPTQPDTNHVLIEVLFGYNNTRLYEKPKSYHKSNPDVNCIPAKTVTESAARLELCVS